MCGTVTCNWKPGFSQVLFSLAFIDVATTFFLDFRQLSFYAAVVSERMRCDGAMVAVLFLKTQPDGGGSSSPAMKEANQVHVTASLGLMLKEPALRLRSTFSSGSGIYMVVTARVWQVNRKF